MHCDYFLESYRRILLCSAVVLTFYFVDQTILCDHFFWKASLQYFHVMVWFLHFWCLDQNMQCENSLESLLMNSTCYKVLFAL